MLWRQHLYILAVSTFDIVASSGVENRNSKILIDLLPNGATFDLQREKDTFSVSNHQTKNV